MNKVDTIILALFCLFLASLTLIGYYYTTDSKCEETRPQCKNKNNCTILVHKNIWCSAKYDTVCQCEKGEKEFIPPNMFEYPKAK